MSTKLHHHHTTGFAMAFGMPINNAISKVVAAARELDAAAEKTSHAQDFGSQIAQAVRRKTSRHAATAVCGKNDDEDDENDSFAERLKKAVQRKSGQKQHKGQAERERSRYQQPQPRQRIKGE